MIIRRSKFWSLVLLIPMIASPAISFDFPALKVTNIRQAFDNGEHNAFTDLIKFRKQYFLTFRSCPDGHMVHPTARIIILKSSNLETWTICHQFHVIDRDTRDPHFLEFKNQLFVFTGTWYSGPKTIPISEYDLNKHLGYAVSTSDGKSWSKPTLLDGTFGHYIWRAASFGDKAYLCGRRKINFEVVPRGEPRKVESLMLESKDGFIWQKKAVFQPIDGDETAFLFESNGSIKAIGRRGSQKAQYLESNPPYDSWDRTELSEYIGGPIIKKWGERYLVGGRQKTEKGYKTSLYCLNNGTLKKAAELPSGGDNSYPGFIALSNSKAIVSWYSTHEKKAGKPSTAIYLANLEIN